MMRTTTVSILIVFALVASACSLPGNSDAAPQVSCSVAGNNPFDPVHLEGPQSTPAEFTVTPMGSTLERFFVGGDGEPEGGSFTESDGFSIVSDSYVLGYQDGLPTSDYLLDGDDIQGWGGCNPTWVNGDQVAGRIPLLDPNL